MTKETQAGRQPRTAIQAAPAVDDEIKDTAIDRPLISEYSTGNCSWTSHKSD
jgi:hypothetical protein